MRTLFLALMIALLPLRGWVGDVMAVELSAPSVATHEHAPASPDGAALPECHEAHATGVHQHGQGASSAAAATDEAAHADCASCTVCQICHSVALTPVLPGLPSAVRPMAAPASSQPLYASAERALGDKPPIF